MLADNTNAWEPNPDGSWDRTKPKKGERRRAAQAVFMRRRDRARRLAAHID
jgi:polyphosphate kinase